MFLIFKFCFIICLFEVTYALTDTSKKKNLQFVENLKQNLRRNNDDYVDLRRSFSQTNNSQPNTNHVNFNDIRYKIITTRENRQFTKSDQDNNKIQTSALKDTVAYEGPKNDDEDERIEIINNIRRRVNDALVSKELVNKAEIYPQRNVALVNDQHNAMVHSNGTLATDNQPAVLRSFRNSMNFLFQQNLDKVVPHQMSLLTNKPNTKEMPQTFTLSTPQTTSFKKNNVKMSKMEKFRKFIEKNKGLLKEFISSKKQAARIRPATPAIQHPIAARELKNSRLRLNNILRLNVAGNKKSFEDLPNADTLDMFPAKGGRIHSKRMKGRLCHRHVLIPEGPKYNSLGHVYLPPHASADIAHEYNATDPPKLLLPRCCNCCRKSVLGCE